MEGKFYLAFEGMKKVELGSISEEVSLKLYGLSKQARYGENTKSEPGKFQFERLKKWKAWNKFKSMSKEEAMRKYIEIAKDYVAANILVNLD